MANMGAAVLWGKALSDAWSTDKKCEEGDILPPIMIDVDARQAGAEAKPFDATAEAARIKKEALEGVKANQRNAIANEFSQLTPQQFDQVVDKLKPDPESPYSYPAGSAKLHADWGPTKYLSVNTTNEHSEFFRRVITLPVQEWSSKTEGDKYHDAFCQAQSAATHEQKKAAIESMMQVQKNWGPAYAQIAERILTNPEVFKCPDTKEQKEHREPKG